jgi:hypothetical protein
MELRSMGVREQGGKGVALVVLLHFLVVPFLELGTDPTHGGGHSPESPAQVAHHGAPQGAREVPGGQEHPSHDHGERGCTCLDACTLGTVPLLPAGDPARLDIVARGFSEPLPASEEGFLRTRPPYLFPYPTAPPV